MTTSNTSDTTAFRMVEAPRAGTFGIVCGAALITILVASLAGWLPTLETIVGCLFLSVFVVFAAMNYHCIIRHRSVGALVGGIAGVIGCVLIQPLRTYCWIPLILDPGTSFIGVAALVSAYRRVRRSH